MMVRYVTPTGRLGRILADAAIRMVRINENNDRTLSRVGALLISLSRHEIVCLLGRGEASSYQFCPRHGKGARASWVPQRRLPRGRADLTASPSKAGIVLEEENGEPPSRTVSNRRRPFLTGRPADPPHKKPTFALRVTPSVSVMFIAFRDSRDVSLCNFLLVLEFPGRPGGACVLRDRIPVRRA
jgi:hypothetical protein